MLFTIIVILVVLWLLGFIGHFGGGLIHLLLVIAVIVLVVQADSRQTRALSNRFSLDSRRLNRGRAADSGSLHRLVRPGRAHLLADRFVIAFDPLR
jgi:hypothetical protein